MLLVYWSRDKGLSPRDAIALDQALILVQPGQFGPVISDEVTGTGGFSRPSAGRRVTVAAAAVRPVVEPIVRAALLEAGFSPTGPYLYKTMINHREAWLIPYFAGTRSASGFAGTEIVFQFTMPG